MSQNLQLDPKKRDYVFSNGSPIASDRVFEAAYYALMIPEGKWTYGVEGQGSLLYQMIGIKRTASVEQTFAAEATRAIQNQVIDQGQADSVSVQNTGATPTTTSNKISIVPSQGKSSQLNFLPV